MEELRGPLTAIVEGEIRAANRDAAPGGGTGRFRLAQLVLQVALILLSSTRLAREASEHAFRFYGALLGLRLSSRGIFHILAPKGIHFLLFFWLGISLYYSLRIGRLQRFAWAAMICLLAALSSEGKIGRAHV